MHFNNFKKGLSMNAIKAPKSFMLLAFVFLSALVSGAQAQEGTNSPSENAGLTQGQTAVIIASRLGLTVEASLTEATAMQLLAQRGISPKGGWDASAPADSGDIARILVQALGMEDGLSASERESADSQAYVDLLIENFGLDVTTLNSGNDLAQGLSNVPSSTPSSTPFTRQNLNAALDALTGTGSNQTNGGSTATEVISPVRP
ncbi:hypothetical protein GP5015_155 [gamma proteobacterium HTCC5015]|nr:hypothetical protein GP5015_155 [gamma proteobacterium HTCC5015]